MALDSKKAPKLSPVSTAIANNLNLALQNYLSLKQMQKKELQSLESKSQTSF